MSGNWSFDFSADGDGREMLDRASRKQMPNDMFEISQGCLPMMNAPVHLDPVLVDPSISFDAKPHISWWDSIEYPTAPQSPDSPRIQDASPVLVQAVRDGAFIHQTCNPINTEQAGTFTSPSPSFPRLQSHIKSPHRHASEEQFRDHPLYQNATPGTDGLYHCPWEGKIPACNHKPEKLRGIYEYAISCA